jgi:hypothetical protein
MSIEDWYFTDNIFLAVHAIRRIVVVTHSRYGKAW